METVVLVFVAFVIGFGLGAKVMKTQSKDTAKMMEPFPTPVAMDTISEVAMVNTKDSC